MKKRKKVPHVDAVPEGWLTRQEAAQLLGYKNGIQRNTVKGSLLSWKYVVLNKKRIAIYNKYEVLALRDPLPLNPEVYVPYKEIVQEVQAARKACGKKPYASRNSVWLLLKRYKVPFIWKKQNEKYYNKKLALKLLVPEYLLYNEDKEDVFLPVNQLFKHVNALRKELQMPPLKNRCMSGFLARRKISFIQTHAHKKFYSLKETLTVYTTTRNRQEHVHRVGTYKEVLSGDFMSLHEAAKVLNCKVRRLCSGACDLSILAWFHPHTNKLWVHFEQARKYAHYRTTDFLFKHLPEEQAQYIILTRQKINIQESLGYRGKKAFYAPELSHL